MKKERVGERARNQQSEGAQFQCVGSVSFPILASLLAGVCEMGMEEHDELNPEVRRRGFRDEDVEGESAEDGPTGVTLTVEVSPVGQGFFVSGEATRRFIFPLPPRDARDANKNACRRRLEWLYLWLLSCPSRPCGWATSNPVSASSASAAGALACSA